MTRYVLRERGTDLVAMVAGRVELFRSIPEARDAAYAWTLAQDGVGAWWRNHPLSEAELRSVSVRGGRGIEWDEVG